VKRLALLLATVAPTVIATDHWRAPRALAVVVLVGFVSWTVGAVAWPRRRGWWRGESEVR